MPKRKRLRLSNYDYSQNGAYFVTICTYKKENLFGDVGADSISARTVAETFEEILSGYPQVCCPKYVIMPNHFHALIVIERADMESAPTVMEIVQGFKRYSTIKLSKLVKEGQMRPYNGKVWQRSFYDHVVRNEQDYLEILQYIEENPIKWQLDRFFVSE